MFHSPIKPLRLVYPAWRRAGVVGVPTTPRSPPPTAAPPPDWRCGLARPTIRRPTLQVGTPAPLHADLTYTRIKREFIIIYTFKYFPVSIHLHTSCYPLLKLSDAALHRRNVSPCRRHIPLHYKSFTSCCHFHHFLSTMLVTDIVVLTDAIVTNVMDRGG
jgi:hypothetical protein